MLVCWALSRWTLMSLGILHLRAGLGEDAALSDHYNMLARELLLQFAHEARLNLLEALQQRAGHEHSDALLVSNINLCGTSDGQFTQRGLQVRVHLQVEQGLPNGSFELIWLISRVLGDLAVTEGRHLGLASAPNVKPHVLCVD